MGILDQMLETQTRIRAKYRIQDDYVLRISTNTLLDCRDDDFQTYVFKKYKRKQIFAAKHEKLLQAYPGKVLSKKEIATYRSKVSRTKDVFSKALERAEEIPEYEGKLYASFKERKEAAAKYFLANRPLLKIEQAAARFNLAYSTLHKYLDERYPGYKPGTWSIDKKWEKLNEWLEKYPEVPVVEMGRRVHLSVKEIMKGIKENRLKCRLDRVDDEYLEEQFGVLASKPQYRNILKTAYFMNEGGEFDYKEAEKRKKKQQIEYALKIFHEEYPRKSIRTIAAECGLVRAEIYSILRKKKLDPRYWKTAKKVAMINQWARDYPDIPLYLLANRAHAFKRSLILWIRIGKITERLSDQPKEIIKQLGEYAIDRNVIKTVQKAYLRLQKQQNLTISHA